MQRPLPMPKGFDNESVEPKDKPPDAPGGQRRNYLPELDDTKQLWALPEVAYEYWGFDAWKNLLKFETYFAPFYDILEIAQINLVIKTCVELAVETPQDIIDVINQTVLSDKVRKELQAVIKDFQNVVAAGVPKAPPRRRLKPRRVRMPGTPVDLRKMLRERRKQRMSQAGVGGDLTDVLKEIDEYHQRKERETRTSRRSLGGRKTKVLKF